MSSPRRDLDKAQLIPLFGLAGLGLFTALEVGCTQDAAEPRDDDMFMEDGGPAQTAPNARGAPGPRAQSAPPPGYTVPQPVCLDGATGCCVASDDPGPNTVEPYPYHGGYYPYSYPYYGYYPYRYPADRPGYGHRGFYGGYRYWGNGPTAMPCNLTGTWVMVGQNDRPGTPAEGPFPAMEVNILPDGRVSRAFCARASGDTSGPCLPAQTYDCKRGGTYLNGRRWGLDIPGQYWGEDTQGEIVRESSDVILVLHIESTKAAGRFKRVSPVPSQVCFE